VDYKEALAIAYQVLEYAELLKDGKEAPSIPELFADDPKFLVFHESMLGLRRILASFAKGDLSTQISSKGYMAGNCKALQANLRHMAWMVKQIENGDYSQRIDFLGEFSVSFNNMVERLAATIEELQQKEETLTELAVSLQREAKRRSEALQELKKSEQKFKDLAQRDPLTDLLNRRSFFSLAEMALQSAASLKMPCCICMLDVDFFKKFNDKFGHVEGDRALQYVAKHSQSKLRQHDIIGRYGGEEFVMLFSSMGTEQGFAAAERIRMAMEHNAFILESGEATVLTVSIGIVVISPDIQERGYAEKLRVGISRADAALYEAKTQGRNRVCMAPPVESSDEFPMIDGDSSSIASSNDSTIASDEDSTIASSEDPTTSDEDY